MSNSTKPPDRSGRQIIDTTGRLWTVNFDDDAIRRVKSQLGVDLQKLSRRLVDFNLDLQTAVALTWCAVEPEALRRGVSPIEFGRSFWSPLATRTLVAALITALSDLLPEACRAEALSVLHRK